MASETDKDLLDDFINGRIDASTMVDRMVARRRAEERHCPGCRCEDGRTPTPELHTRVYEAIRRINRY